MSGGVYKVERNGIKGAMKLVKHIETSSSSKKKINFARMLKGETLVLSDVGPHRNLPQLIQPFTYAPKLPWYFMVTEHVSKGSLYDYVTSGHKIPWACIYGIAWRLVDCLRHMHQAGWFHLDVKPGNILLTDDPERGLVLIDFGLSKSRSQCKVFPRISAAGTYSFMGQHVWNLERESARDDLESVAFVIAWLIQGGSLPWSSDKPEEMRKKIQHPNLLAQLGSVSSTLECYLRRVRALGVDETPSYDEFLSLLASEAGSHVQRLVW
jgi:serine/threonine protein kinase